MPDTRPPVTPSTRPAGQPSVNAYPEPLAGHTQTAVRSTEPLSAEVGIGRGASVVTWIDIGVPAARLDTPIHSQLAMIQSERESPAVIPILEIKNQIGRQAGVFCDRMPFPARRNARHLCVRHGAVPLDRIILGGKCVVIMQPNYRKRGSAFPIPTPSTDQFGMMYGLRIDVGGFTWAPASGRGERRQGGSCKACTDAKYVELHAICFQSFRAAGPLPGIPGSGPAVFQGASRPDDRRDERVRLPSEETGDPTCDAFQQAGRRVR